MAGQLVPVRVGEVELLVEATPVAGSQPTSRMDAAIERTGNTFTRAQTAIVQIASSTVEVIHRSAQRAARPDQLEVEFGLKFSAKGDVIVAGASGEASLKVKLTYKTAGGSAEESKAR